MNIHRIRSGIQEFISSQSAGGVVLAVSALLALIVSNSPWKESYDALVAMRGEIRLGEWLVLSKPLLVWVNDLWMAVFFFLVGLEIKRELREGELSTRSQIMLPAAAALGGIVVPALIYSAFNWGDAKALRGWAIPAATDIAFALGVLALLGSRVPNSLKVFLTAVAIIDDLGAIVVIAFFYTDHVNLGMLALAVCGGVVLWALNLGRVTRILPYLLVGLLVWLFVLKSGVHATVAGVMTALAIPLKDADGGSPLREAEHTLHPWIAFLVLPVFAFVNAGVSLQGVSLATLVQSVPLGIAGGLVVGKVCGVFGASGLLIRFTAAQLPAGAQWGQLLGVSVLCGIGFTMSLFIGALAFAGQGVAFETQLKIGVLCGSLISGVAGTLLLLRYPKTAAV